MGKAIELYVETKVSAGKMATHAEKAEKL